MEKHNFTAQRIATYRCKRGAQQTIYWDARTPGLGLRITAGGAKAYVFETRLYGRTLRVTIGDPKTWSIRKAQERATELKTLTDKNIDPRQVAREQARAADEKKAQEAAEAQRDALLVRQAWQAYLDACSKHWSKRHTADHAYSSQAGGEKKKRGVGTTTPGVLSSLLPMRMVDITADTLITWQLRESSARPTKARQGFELFRAFWRWCAARTEYRAIIDAQAVESADLRKEVPSRKDKRFDVLERGQIAAWFEAVQRLENPVASTYLQALLLTGARREEMAELRWKDVDFRWKSLWVKDKVAEEGRKIPLTPYLSQLLLRLKQINETPPVKSILSDDRDAEWAPSEWVFFSKSSASGRIVEPRIAHNRALSVAGLNHVTLHGLRRTFASLAEWVEMPTGVVAQIMGHKPSATAERHYKNRPLDLLASWHRKYEAWILDQAGISSKLNSEERPLRMVGAG